MSSPNPSQIKAYSASEETLNVVSHGIGFILSIAGSIALILQGLKYGGGLYLIGVSVFGCALMILYGSSTLYHSSQSPARRRKLRVLDHISIYLLIAGTYTPFTLITLQGSVGWVIFAVSWTMAIVGITLKLFFTGKYTLVSTLMYVFMGWLILFAIDPLLEALDTTGMNWLAAGGIAYTIGAVFHSIKAIPFGHAIFHLLVLIGSGCHFVAVYIYV